MVDWPDELKLDLNPGLELLAGGRAGRFVPGGGGCDMMNKAVISRLYGILAAVAERKKRTFEQSLAQSPHYKAVLVYQLTLQTRMISRGR